MEQLSSSIPQKNADQIWNEYMLIKKSLDEKLAIMSKDLASIEQAAESISHLKSFTSDACCILPQYLAEKMQHQCQSYVKDFAAKRSRLTPRSIFKFNISGKPKAISSQVDRTSVDGLPDSNLPGENDENFNSNRVDTSGLNKKMDFSVVSTSTKVGDTISAMSTFNSVGNMGDNNHPKFINKSKMIEHENDHSEKSKIIEHENDHSEKSKIIEPSNFIETTNDHSEKSNTIYRHNSVENTNYNSDSFENTCTESSISSTTNEVQTMSGFGDDINSKSPSFNSPTQLTNSSGYGMTAQSDTAQTCGNILPLQVGANKFELKRVSSLDANQLVNLTNQAIRVSIDSKTVYDVKTSTFISLSLKNLKNCIVFIDGRPNSIYITEAIGCVIVVEQKSLTSIFVNNSHHSVFVLESQQVRVSDCQQCDFYCDFSVKDGVILDHCTNCFLSKRSKIDYQDSTKNDTLPSPPTDRQQYAELNPIQVVDFNWLSKRIPSPNYKHISNKDSYIGRISIYDGTPSENMSKNNETVSVFCIIDNVVFKD